ncbi:MAG: hypothetical protein LBF49_02650 [Puniceicoccales bacterium]|jgi:hypothetical protein|nr:hypothetical protein [Puniceicoccales bacterium]
MRQIERSLSAPYGSLRISSPGISSVKKDGGDPKIVDPVVAGSGKIGIPPSKVPGGALETHSAVAAPVPPPPVVVPRNPRVNHPVSWLEFTVENTAGLREDEIVRLLLFQDRPDPSKFGTIFFLPDGDQIVRQLVNGMSGNRLLEFVGRDAISADSFTCIFFEKKYFVEDMDEDPTMEDMRDSVLIECEPLPPGLPKGKFEERITVVARAMKDAYANKGKRGKFEGKLRNVVDSIFAKLPPPNEENQEYWDNICEAIETVIDESPSADNKKRLAEARERFPVLDIALSKTKQE